MAGTKKPFERERGAEPSRNYNFRVIDSQVVLQYSFFALGALIGAAHQPVPPKVWLFRHAARVPAKHLSSLRDLQTAVCVAAEPGSSRTCLQTGRLTGLGVGLFVTGNEPRLRTKHDRPNAYMRQVR